MANIESTIRAFSADQVMKLTGLSKRQLVYWDDTEFFKPRFAAGSRTSPYSRIYSFKDVVGLRALGLLRNKYKIPLQHLRKVGEKLREYMHNPWSEIVLYVKGKEVVFEEPDTHRHRSVLEGQYVESIAIERVAHDVAAESEKLRDRTPEQFGQIYRNRYLVHNATVIAGTRIPTKTVWRFHAAGFSTAKIIEEYPALTEKDVEAAIAHEEKILKRA